MLYMSLFWKIHKDYYEALEINKQKTLEKKCKHQFKEYLKYLKTKNINIKEYISFENILVN